VYFPYCVCIWLFLSSSFVKPLCCCNVSFTTLSLLQNLLDCIWSYLLLILCYMYVCYVYSIKRDYYFVVLLFSWTLQWYRIKDVNSQIVTVLLHCVHANLRMVSDVTNYKSPACRREAVRDTRGARYDNQILIRLHTVIQIDQRGSCTATFVRIQNESAEIA